MLDERATIPRPGDVTVPEPDEIDFERLRAGRLARLQAEMRRHELPVCLFFNPANIRYATGTDVMGVWTAGTFARYCVVPAEGAPILFEYEASAHISRRIVADVRPAFAWQFGGHQTRDKVRGWASEMRAVLRELGLEREPLAVDKLDTPGFLALEDEGITVVDSGPATVDAREVKTPEEIELLRINGRIGAEMLAEFEAAIRPGIREFELLAVLGNALLKRHGEFLFTRLVASGQNTNPWMSEAHDKLVEAGDLVGVDTDANGYEGYVVDVSRTFLCGDEALPGQQEAYGVARECVTGMTELVRPGMSFEEFAHAAPALPEKFREQRYPVMVHQAGLEDEGPGIPYPDDDKEARRIMPEREIRENMVLCFECYAGEVGGPFGVKLEDQVVVTKDGAELLCEYPYESKLLASF